MNIEIKHRITGTVIFSLETESLRICLQAAVKAKTYLIDAYLSGADLIGANLIGANLSGANLIGANLSGANLIGANLSGADLSGANLIGANLSGANLIDAYMIDAYLSGANLRGANLSGAYLSGANLSGANLIDADLSGADLIGANLSGANLSGANLSGADLIGANLSGANLSGANLIDADLSGANLAAQLGQPNGWHAWTYIGKDGLQRVRVGCRDKTIAEGREYWANKPDRREVLAAIDYAEQIATLRGWSAVTKKGASMKGRYDNLHGDEPEIDALAANAEHTRDVDAEIDRKKEQYAMLDSKVVSTASGIVETSLRIISLCTDMARFPLAASPDEVIELEGHLAHLKTLTREMAK